MRRVDLIPNQISEEDYLDFRHCTATAMHGGQDRAIIFPKT